MEGQGPGGGLLGLGCMACGSRDLEVTRPGWVEDASDWLRFGGRWRPSSQRCRRCGQVDSDRSVRYLVQRTGWWRVPAQLVGVLRHRRSRVPVPATYLLAAAVGAVLGGGAQLAFGWPWWLVATGVLAAVWLFFAASAFPGRGSGRPLATEMLLATDPARAIQRERRELVERFRAAPFPLYGLPVSWPGTRHLGGCGSRRVAGQRPVLTALSLAHGDPLARQGPQLLVEVRADPEEPAQPPGGDPELRARLAADLRWTAETAAAHGRNAPPDGGGHAGPGTEPPGRDAEPPGRGGRPGRADRAWTEVAIPVDGRPVSFEWLDEGRHWAAVGELQGRTLVLNARDLAVEEVELVAVGDVEPYVEGTRRLEEVRARHRDHHA